MDTRDWLAQRFEEHRPRLRAVAYRMLGSTTEADDAVQEAWIRLSRSKTGEIDNLEAWLVTAVGRVDVEGLHARVLRRAEPVQRHASDDRRQPATSHLCSAGCLPFEMVNEKETDHMATYRARSGEEVVVWA